LGPKILHAHRGGDVAEHLTLLITQVGYEYYDCFRNPYSYQSNNNHEPVNRLSVTKAKMEGTLEIHITINPTTSMSM
jgi:hypothetical protein